MLNYLVCSIPIVNNFCGINFDLVFLWMLPLFGILLLNEIIDYCTDLSREIHRKTSHVFTGILLITSTYYLEQLELLTLSIGLLVVLLITKIGKFATIYSVERKTQGTLYYVVVVAILALWWIPERPELFRYGIWILTVPDALAALIGSRWGTQIPFFNKSVLGSCVFFISAIMVTACFVHTWWIILFIALTLTMIEFFGQWGTDNLLLPIVGTYLLFSLI